MTQPNIVHKCTVNKNEEQLDKLHWFQKIRLVSPDNPFRLTYFRSELAVKEEQYRHLKVNRYVIHPFSKLRAWYEMYMVYLHFSLLITKPFDSSFMRLPNFDSMPVYRAYSIGTELLYVIHIILNLTLFGYDNQSNNSIELRPLNIAKHYILSPFFFVDIISCIPYALVTLIAGRGNRAIFSMYASINILALVRITRLVTVLNYIRRSAEYFRYSAKGVIFLVCSIVASVIIVHWMSCLQFFIPKLIRRHIPFPYINNQSWFIGDPGQPSIYYGPLISRYIHCLFKSSAYMLGIRIGLYKMSLPEEYLLAIFTYFVGKILIAFIWIILAVAILNSRVMDIKFAELMNQLEEYMTQKQLPLNLRNRISQYFIFKYRHKYFKEALITNLLSENLRRKANLHACKSLANVPLFRDLSTLEINMLVDKLIPEILLPNDIIIQAGEVGDAMYFLASGTVAVYTRSGREICHLEDGAYFGELALVMKGHLRLSTAVAIEACQVYRLNKKDLEQYLLSNEKVLKTVQKNAEARFNETTKTEEDYKKMLFEQEFRESAKEHQN